MSNDLDTLPACYLASKLKKATLIYDSHELFSEGPELQGRKFVQGFWRRLESIFLPRIKRAFTVSNSIASYYNAKYKTQFGVVRNVPELQKKIIEKKVTFLTSNKTVLYQVICIVLNLISEFFHFKRMGGGGIYGLNPALLPSWNNNCRACSTGRYGSLGR